MPDMSVLRQSMMRYQIAARGVSDDRVLDAMRAVPREAFMPEALAEFAYEDSPLPIEEGQTISQPSIVALMIAAIQPRPQDRVLAQDTPPQCSPGPSESRSVHAERPGDANGASGNSVGNFSGLAGDRRPPAVLGASTAPKGGRAASAS